MKNSQIVFLACVSIGLSGSAGRAQTVIYGDDHRKDGVEILDSGRAFWFDQMRSTVGLWSKKNVTPNIMTGKTSLKTETHQKREKLCDGETFAEQRVGPFCSGSLIAPNLVLTAGHCVYDQASCEDMAFVFDFRIDAYGELGPESVPSSQVYGCKKLHDREDDPVGGDFAIVELDRAVTDRLPVSLEKSQVPVAGDPVLSIGHPSGLPAKLADGANIRSVEPKFFRANLDTFYNNSGSPIFNEKTGNQVGILVRGEQDFRWTWKGCRVVNECADDECDGEDVTRMDHVLPFLKPFGL